MFRRCFIWVSMKMLQYQKTDVSEGIDVNKTNASKECELCHYWFFKDVGFKFEEHIWMLWFINDGLFFKKYSYIKCKRSWIQVWVLQVLLMGTSKNEMLKKLNNSVTYDKGIL